MFLQKSCYNIKQTNKQKNRTCVFILVRVKRCWKERGKNKQTKENPDQNKRWRLKIINPDLPWVDIAIDKIFLSHWLLLCDSCSSDLSLTFLAYDVLVVPVLPYLRTLVFKSKVSSAYFTNLKCARDTSHLIPGFKRNGLAVIFFFFVLTKNSVFFLLSWWN